MLNIGILNAIGENEVVFIDFNAERLLKIDAMQDVKSPPANGLLFAFNAENIYGFMLFIGVIKYNSPICNLSYLYKVFFVLKNCHGSIHAYLNYFTCRISNVLRYDTG